MLNLGRGLHAARAITDNGDALTAEVDVRGPFGGVKARALKAIQSLDVGHLDRIENADRTDQEIGGAGHRAAIAVPHPQLPVLRRAVVVGSFDRSIEADVATQIELRRDVFQISLELIAQREVLAPVIGREGKRIEMIGRIDAGAGIAVVAPDAAEGRALFQDYKRNAGALKMYRGT